MHIDFAAAILQAGQGGGASLASLVMPLGVVVLMFFLIVPQMRRQKRWQKMLGALKVGDKVVTSGGIKGVIVTIKSADGGSSGDALIIKVAPDNIKLEVSRSSVMTVITTDDGPKA